MRKRKWLRTILSAGMAGSPQPQSSFRDVRLWLISDHYGRPPRDEVEALVRMYFPEREIQHVLNLLPNRPARIPMEDEKVSEWFLKDLRRIGWPVVTHDTSEYSSTLLVGVYGDYLELDHAYWDEQSQEIFLDDEVAEYPDGWETNHGGDPVIPIRDMKTKEVERVISEAANKRAEGVEVSFAEAG